MVNVFRKYTNSLISVLISFDYIAVYLVSGLLINLTWFFSVLYLARTGQFEVKSFYYFAAVLIFTSIVPVYGVHIIETVREKGIQLAIQIQPHIKYSKWDLLDAWGDFLEAPFNYKFWVLIFSVVASVAIILPAAIIVNITHPIFLLIEALVTIAIGFLPIFPTSYVFFYIIFLVKKIYSLRNLDIQINIFNLVPIYSISQLTQRLGIYLLPYATFFGVVGGYYLGDTGSLTMAWQIIGLLSLALSSFIFIAPVLWLKRLIQQQKKKLLVENALRIDTVISEQNKRIDTGHLESAGALNSIVDSLLQRQILISRISEWPWDPAILKEFIATLFVPIIIWSLQYYLSKAF